MNLNQVKIYFYVRPSTVKGKRGNLYVRVNINSERITCSVKSLEMYPSEFDVTTQNPKKKCDLYFECQNFMVGIRQEINKIHNEFEKKRFVFTKQHLNKAVQEVYYRVKHGRPSDAKTYLNLYDEALEIQKGNIGISLSKGTYSVRKRYRNIIELALSDSGLLETPICNFSEKEITKIYTFIKKKYAIGTAARICPVFATVFKFALKNEHISENPCEDVDTIKYGKTTDRVWLENEELQKLIALDLSGQAERYRDSFAFCCYTGLSFGDYLLLNPETCDEIVKKAESPKDIQPGEIVTMRSGSFLIGKRRKTGTMYRVPILPEAEVIMKKYGGIEKMPFNLRDTGNILNMLMQMIGCNKTVRFHTARKTMANYLINVKMINPYYVIEIMGWRKIEEATPYTVVNNDTLAHQFFNKKEISV